MSIHGIKPENYYRDVLQNTDYYLTGEKPIFKKVIKEAYSHEQVLKLLEPSLTIPKSIADELEEEIEEAYSSDSIRSYSDVGAYMEVITEGLDEDSELYKFMFPANDALLGCSHRNIIYLYLVDNDLVKVVEG